MLKQRVEFPRFMYFTSGADALLNERHLMILHFKSVCNGYSEFIDTKFGHLQNRIHDDLRTAAQ
jgi:hypothetical protein